MIINSPATAYEYAASWAADLDYFGNPRTATAIRKVLAAADDQVRILGLTDTPRHSVASRELVRATRRALVGCALYLELGDPS